MPEYGEIGRNGSFNRMMGMLEEDKLHAVMICEESGVPATEVYEKYVKLLGAKTVCYGMSEEKRTSWLEAQGNDAHILVFLTAEQVRSIVRGGCPEDMKIRLSWCQLNGENSISYY